MKKVIFILTVFFLGITKVNAYTSIDVIKISQDRTKYEIMGSSLTRPSLADKQKFVFDEKDVVNYNTKIEEYLNTYYSNTFLDGGMDDNGNIVRKSALLPAELVTLAVFKGGGSDGSCRLVNHEIDCSSRDNPANWTHSQRTRTEYLRESYPMLMDELVAIRPKDIYEPISFLNPGTNLPNSILDNGNIDSEGRWVATTPIKIYESEYEKGSAEIFANESNPYGVASLYFSKDGFRYTQKGTGTALYETWTDEQINNVCAVYYDNPHYMEWCQTTLNESKGRYLGSIQKVPIDKKNNVIHGIWFTLFNSSDENSKLNKARKENGFDGFAAIYEFEVPIEVIPDVKSESNYEELEKKKTGMQENNAKIFIDNKEVTVKNLKDYDLGRIYVSLEDICKNIDNCNIEQGTDSENKPFYRITRKILNTEIEFALIHYPNTKIFETTTYKNNDKLNYDIISPAVGRVDSESKVINGVLYVPIRFVVEGLGANINYIGSRDGYPEEVHVSFIDTGDMKIDSDNLKQSSQNDKYTTTKDTNNINFTTNLDGTSNFYTFQLNSSSVQITNDGAGDYKHQVVFKSKGTYKYLVVSKTNNNGSEFMAYKIFELEYE